MKIAGDNVVQALKALIEKADLASATEFFGILGYKSTRHLDLPESPSKFFQQCEQLDIHVSPKDREAISSACTSIQMIFQVTGDEIADESNGAIHFKKDCDESYLFFVVELAEKGSSADSGPTRGLLTDLTRRLNSVFRIPVLALFRYGQNGNTRISLGVINRRPSKRDYQRTVQGRVSLIKDINVTVPHRAHVEILKKFSLPGIQEAFPRISTFKELDDAWQNVLDLKELNKSFYRDIMGWFNWAKATIQLPRLPEGETIELTSDECKGRFVLRLISRMLFCWFIKERGLIDQRLLEVHVNRPEDSVISNLKPTAESSYYCGVLQNIFFRCLNRPMSEGREHRQFLDKDVFQSAFDYDMFEAIPYLNGGLFDEVPGDFVGETGNRSFHVPNELFYNNRAARQRIRTDRGTVAKEGLNQILDRYVFTVEENTALDEEVALDPELLGMVFENLLAELDEDSREAAQKESGTYYTPRKIIDYMVSECLYLYLKNELAEVRPKGEIGALKKLVFSTSADFESPSVEFCRAIVHAIARLRVLDPACGSGAFPMGMLQAVTKILDAVDPDNKEWLKIHETRVDQARARKVMGSHSPNYLRKLDVIQNVIYGVDIQPNAILISKLRFFISLLIDQRIDPEDRKHNYHITPLPNLETKLVCADSLNDVSSEQYHLPEPNKIRKLRDQYHQPDMEPSERKALAKEIAELLADSYPNFADNIRRPGERPRGSKTESKELFYEWFLHASVPAPFFSVEMCFPEIGIDSGGFHIVIGNPPYGGTKISDEVETNLRLGSKDRYGAFIARFLGDGQRHTPLKDGGLLSYIVSDTFMTIKTHLPLREQIMENVIHKMVRVHRDTFRATVNAAVILCQKRRRSVPASNDLNDNVCLMADLTNLNIHDPDQEEEFRNVLAKTRSIEAEKEISTDTFAIYYYPQSLIRSNSNLPFFVASPKLFAFMNNQTTPTKRVHVGDREVLARTIEFNGSDVDVVRLGDIADVKQGLATGDNDSYLFQNPNARGSYRDITQFKDFLLTAGDLDRIGSSESLRREVVEKGISKGNKDSNRYFGGRYIAPYDKGGESDAAEEWMPNYYVPTDYFIDWSEWAVRRMKALTTAQRNREQGKTGGSDAICSRFQNTKFYFRSGLTFSRTGIYAPTFRLSNLGPFDTEGSMMFFPDSTDLNDILGLVCSGLSRYLMKSFIDHSVHAQIDDLKELVVPFPLPDIRNLVSRIVERQSRKPRYSYLEHEQISIDDLVEEAMALSEDDKVEMIHWKSRRYPQLGRPALTAREQRAA